jgi:hypothetical protein
MLKLAKHVHAKFQHSSFHPNGLKIFLEHIFKKMGSTEIVMSSVRLSVRPSVRLCAISQPV